MKVDNKTTIRLGNDILRDTLHNGKIPHIRRDIYIMQLCTTMIMTWWNVPIGECYFHNVSGHLQIDRVVPVKNKTIMELTDTTIF